MHLVTPEYFPAVGGVAEYTRQVARGLADAGKDVHVWCPASSRSDGESSIVVHAELGKFDAADLAHADDQLEHFGKSQRLLIQWVPHGFGHHAMNVAFCQWLLRHSKAGDRVELMVHEPFVTFWEGTWRQSGVALVHRMMTAMLLQAASKVWVSIPAWEQMWKPYTFGRDVPFEWLPIPSALPIPAVDDIARVRARFGGVDPVVGHFGTFGGRVSVLLQTLLEEMFRSDPGYRVVLIGSGSEQFRSAFVSRFPRAAERLAATGTLSIGDLAAHVAACDLLLQPYPDGLTSRRTTAIGGLKLGVPIVSTTGYLTEPFWSETSAVDLLPVGDDKAMLTCVSSVLSDANRRRQMSGAGRELYDGVFDLRRTVTALTSGAPASGRAA